MFAFEASAQSLLDDIGSDECVRIGEIRLKPNDVFQDYSHASYIKKPLNFLHYTTQQSVLEKELLFGTDDCFDYKLIEETERNLRAMGIFSYVEIMTEPHDNLVDVTVTTRDKFTLRLELSASQSGSETKTRMSLGEKNIVGLNKRFHYSKTHITGKETKSRLFFSDPRIFHDYAAGYTHENVEGNELESYRFSKPFRSLADRYSYFYQYYEDGTDTNYAVADEDDINIPKHDKVDKVGFSTELGSSKYSRRIGVNLSHKTLRYFPENATQNGVGNLDVEDISNSSFEFEALKSASIATHYIWRKRDKYLRLKGVDSLISQEDILLQESFNIGLGVQRREDVNDTQYHNTLSFGWGLTNYRHLTSGHESSAVEPNEYGFYAQSKYLSSFSLNSSIRLYRGDIREIINNAYYHGYFFLSPSQSFVGALTYSYKHARDELNLPISLGADIGLRGHDVGALTGNKRLIMNFEHRYRYLTDSQNVAFGQVFFVDAGYAWKHKQSVNLKDLEVDVGLGFRMNLPSILGKNLFRIDVGMSLDTQKPLASVTIGQMFSYDKVSAPLSKDY